ncbi:uncharacterized protein LOC112599094 [Melanaphis sacchari]|uniref:uncharacterized protein LOC112599094 n=1 Tax=Melanaphis sacchari TaxID=742174 RepID=UPI000DC1402B|nr:uncharacterized protein LOC112599094 [Melanaphis sacchari]
MYFKITMFWFELNTILMISAVSQVCGLNQNASNISNNFHYTKNEPSFLILKDIQGNMYKYIYPNDMDQFSKMSTLGNKNSSTVIHLPPGILKTENSTCETDIASEDNPKITSERSRTTTPKSTTNNNALSRKSNDNIKLKLNKNPSVVVDSVLSTTERRNSVVNHTTENESTETTTIQNSKNKHTTEKDEDGNGIDVKQENPILKTGINPHILPYDNNTKENLNYIIIERLFLLKKNGEKHENSNEQQNLYKSSDTPNSLILLIENNIKLKLFKNSNGILKNSSPVNSRKNSTLKVKDELSTEDDITSNYSPISIGEVE